MAASHRGPGTQTIGQITLEHTIHRLGLGTLAIGFAGLVASQLAGHVPPILRCRRLASRSPDADLDQDFQPQLFPRYLMIGVKVKPRVGQHTTQAAVAFLGGVDDRQKLWRIRSHAGLRLDRQY